MPAAICAISRISLRSGDVHKHCAITIGADLAALNTFVIVWFLRIREPEHRSAVDTLEPREQAEWVINSIIGYQLKH